MECFEGRGVEGVRAIGDRLVPDRRGTRSATGVVMLKRGWIFAAALAALFGSHEAVAAGVFTLTSSSFKDGERLAQKHAGNNKSNPNCVGENISPELTISNPPDGTKSFA